MAIDGWHNGMRSRRGMRLAEVPCVVLTEDETKSIRY